MTEHLNISRDSIDRTIHILVEKNIIKFKEHKSHGKKIYILNSKNEAQNYYKKLEAWESVKEYKKLVNKLKKSGIQNFGKIMKKFNQQFSLDFERTKYQWFRIPREEFFDTKIHLKNKEEQQKLTDIPWPELITINNIKFKAGKKIFTKYINNRYCLDCFREKKILVDLQDNNDELVCKNGHVFEKESYDSPYWQHNASLPVMSKKKLTEKQTQNQIKEFLDR